MKIQDTQTNVLINNTAKKLKEIKEITKPEWANFVKTSRARERPPVDIDWWYVRAASILRKTYLLGPIGVNKLKVKYGGKKNRGHKPEKFFKGSGKIIRMILQQLETAKLIEQTEKGSHKGRILTAKGKSLLDKK
jgi:small subunit ribosomal protein S19e